MAPEHRAAVGRTIEPALRTMAVTRRLNTTGAETIG